MSRTHIIPSVELKGNQTEVGIMKIHVESCLKSIGFEIVVRSEEVNREVAGARIGCMRNCFDVCFCALSSRLLERVAICVEGVCMTLLSVKMSH